MRPPLGPTHPVAKVAARLVIRSTQRRRRSVVARPPLTYEPQPVFILGPPRCGSTIAYQAMTNLFKVVYVDNLAALWAADLPQGVRRSMRAFGLTPHDSFDAAFGDTRSSGWHAPNECGGFWYRWIPTDTHHVGSADLDASMVDGPRQEVAAIESEWHLPVVFKNPHLGQRLDWLKASFPKARYVRISRDPERVAHSILKARARHGVPDHVLWSTRPKQHDDIEHLPPEDMVRRQVSLLEEEISRGLAEVPAQQQCTLHFNDMSAGRFREIAIWLGLTARQDALVPHFKRDAG